MADLSADIEEVTQWAASKKLSVDTVKTLIAYGYESMDALETLTPEDISKAKIPVGQMKLLLKAVRNTFRAEDTPSPVAAQQCRDRRRYLDPKRPRYRGELGDV